jgi:hypothetical protein
MNMTARTFNPQHEDRARRLLAYVGTLRAQGSTEEQIFAALRVLNTDGPEVSRLSEASLLGVLRLGS